MDLTNQAARAKLPFIPEERMDIEAGMPLVGTVRAGHRDLDVCLGIGAGHGFDQGIAHRFGHSIEVHVVAPRPGGEHAALEEEPGGLGVVPR